MRRYGVQNQPRHEFISGADKCCRSLPTALIGTFSPRSIAVLGTALAIKMIAYVGIAPIAGSLAGHVSRRPFLVAMDLVRASTANALPFVTQVWQIYLLIFLLQAASAAFTPTFQAIIPDVLPDERDYTRALSLSRLAYDSRTCSVRPWRLCC